MSRIAERLFGPEPDINRVVPEYVYPEEKPLGRIATAYYEFASRMISLGLVVAVILAVLLAAAFIYGLGYELVHGSGPGWWTQ